jgi:hypothetical protein
MSPHFPKVFFIFSYFLVYSENLTHSFLVSMAILLPVTLKGTILLNGRVPGILGMLM